MKHKYIEIFLLIAVAFLAVLAIIFVWWNSAAKAPKTTVVKNPAAAPAQQAVNSSLGAQIYQQSSNPIANKLPSSSSATKVQTDPFSGYVNPFGGQ